MKRALWLLALSLAGALSGAAAQEESGEPAAAFYATATVEERPLDEATAAVTVLDREAIEASGAATVAELLRFVPGVDLTTGGTRGGLTTAQIRGGDPNFTLVLLDGVPLNDGTYQVGEVFNFEALPAAAVERIEVVRGPLSAIYGSTGLAGAIHVITRSGDESRWLEAEAAAGDASLVDVRAAAGGPRYFLHAQHQQEEGRIADERFELRSVQGSWQARWAEALELRLAGRLASWEGDDYPDASGGPVFGSGQLRRAENQEASLGLEVRAGRSEARRHKLTAAVYRHELERESPAVFPQVPESLEDSRFTRVQLGWALTLRPRERLQLSLGADVAREEGVNESVLLLPPFLGGEVAGDYSLTRTNPGVYGELISHRGPVTLEFGTRLDWPDGEGAELSPRLGVSYRPGGGPTRLRASAGRAFKLPSFFAQASPPALGGNPDLEPEEMVGVDVGVEHRFAAGVEAGLGVFANRYRNLVDFDFETFTHLNRSRVRARGVESFLDWQPRKSVQVAANLTFQDVEDEATGQGLRHRPRWVGGLRLDWRPRGVPDLRLHGDGRWVSSSLDEQIPVPDRREVAGHIVFGAGGSWRFAPGWALTLRIDNLTDEAYETLIGFPGPGRAFRLGLERSPTTR